MQQILPHAGAVPAVDDGVGVHIAVIIDTHALAGHVDLARHGLLQIGKGVIGNAVSQLVIVPHRLTGRERDAASDECQSRRSCGL